MKGERRKAKSEMKRGGVVRGWSGGVKSDRIGSDPVIRCRRENENKMRKSVGGQHKTTQANTGRHNTT
jgi:hypothetical protein